MKKLICLFGFLQICSTLLFSQSKIQGKYQSHDPYQWFTLQLFGDSTFSHSTCACGGGGESHGTWTIKNKLITLNYQGTDTLKSFKREKINCDGVNKNNFCNYQFGFKKGETKTYKIKRCNKKEIILTDETSNTILIRLRRVYVEYPPF